MDQEQPKGAPAGTKLCCQDAANLVEEDSGRPDVVLRRCKVCKCRHFEATVDPGVIGIKGANL